MGQPIILTPRRSALLSLAVAAMHLLAGLSVALTTLPPTLIAAIWLLLAVSLWRHGRVSLPAEIVLRPDGRLLLVERDGSRTESSVAAHSVAYSWLVVLWVRRDGRWRPLNLPRDVLPADQHRRLRLWLRWRAVSVPA